ncbi:SusD/RagB family nutrient-binding outer membrane lipoprotein [Chryseobacterium wangxinyae]|uniref:SusD/RagB family nutrient-binding outer membrane lipoprotein n=1 Tax=Chryseobacterium sp. CY353 TaxID=2997334 RepID=UPI002271939F|nr:SusD/RagB family nutrient-binding outer membrane lipoprotein [Chryseobacterium sp. CY353]MCY0971113.1 SusD/RagB family nutrient-binding outer membrane lipoprotein [Chryseobacterium sp. CY353]
MKRKISIIMMALAIFSSQSCERNFEEINNDTSRILTPSVGSLLAPIQLEMGSYGYLRATDFTFDLMQVSLDFPNEGNTFSRYYMNEGSGNSLWNTSYRWLKQVNDLKDYSVKEQNNNYHAISLVLNAWIYSNLTDSFGDVPFSEAIKTDEGILKPKFDKQKDIYIQLLNDLKTANGMFEMNKTLSDTDLFYNANENVAGILNWKKFCNSLSLRLLVRILKRNGEVDVHDRIKEIVNNPSVYPIFQNNNDSALLSLSGIAPFLPPFARPNDFTAGRVAGEFFVNTLKNTNDPRMSMFFTQAKNLATNANLGYKGAPSGYALATTFNYQPSNLHGNLAKAPMKILVMTYSEVQFILAELAYKGIISGTAKVFYDAGSKSIIEQWGAVVPANYLTNANVAYNNTLERIMLQKYTSLFFVDQQQWYEQRRTGIPALPNNGGLQNNGQLPVRYMYPTGTKVMNADNYNNAVLQMGGDDINVKMWWNK